MLLALGVSIGLAVSARVVAAPRSGQPPAAQPPGAAPAASTPVPAGSVPAPAGSVPLPGTPAAEKPEEPPTEAEALIDAAIKKLGMLKSVAADLVENIDMLNQKIVMKGRYLKAEGFRAYLRLTISGIADTSGTALQVCDGETLWDYEQLFENQIYRKVSIKPVMELLDSPNLDPKLKDQFVTQMGIAGPETLLRGLRKTLRFDQKEEGELDGVKVWILRGTWKNRQGLTMPDSRPVPAVGILPPYIPMDGTLYLGKDDSWPYKLVLVGRKPTGILDTRRKGPDGRPIGALRSIETVDPSRIELVYSNVKLNAGIKLDEFAFQSPPTATPEDNTQAIVNGLTQAIQMESARKKAESTKKEEPTLEKAIDIPTPSETVVPK
jgi:outer membrane lipoprotein-sorting protein